METPATHTKHPWRVRLIVGLIMLVLAFIGLMVTDVEKNGGWTYWKWVGPIYAILALFLSWYVRKQKNTITPITLWHEVVHWIGVNAAMFLVVFYVHLGITSRFLAGIFDLTLLSLGIFLAGVYIEPTFILIGIVLGILAALSAFVVQYLYVVMIPLFLAGVAIIAAMIWLSHHNTNRGK